MFFKPRKSGKLFRGFIVLTIALLVLAGCSPSKPTSSGGSQASGDNKEKVLKVGILGPFTGPASRVGEEFKNATTLAFEQVGNKIGDYKIEIKWIDSQSDAQKAALAYEQAVVKDKIDVGFMDWHSWVSVSVMDIAAKYKIPHFFSFGATSEVNQKYKADPNKYVYWMGKAWPTANKLSIGYVKTIDEAVQRGDWKPANKKVAIYGVDNDWGRDFGASLGQQFKDAGWEIVATEWVGLGETDFYPMLNKLKSLNVSVVAGTMSDPPAVSAFIKQIREVGLKSIVVADGLGWIGEWYSLTGDASNYVLDQIPQWTTPEAKKFAVDFKAKFGFEPGASTAGMNYDWARYFIKVLQETLKDYGSLTRENIFNEGKEKVMTGKLTLKDGIIHKEYKYTPETWPDPVVDQEHYMFPVVQYFGGKGTVVWPDSFQETKIKIPDNLK